jgi:ribosome-interacting GTPase 1
MSEEDLKAELAKLKAENEALKKSSARGISLKVSQKGAVSLYGMGRFPVTLYKEQWLKILEMSDVIKNFVAENDAQLKAKE